MAEQLGKAEVQITATTSGPGGLDQGLKESEKKVASFGKSVKSSIAGIFGPAAASLGAVHSIGRLVNAWREYQQAASKVGEENRRIQESIVGASGLGSAMTELEESLERINKSYERTSREIGLSNENFDAGTWVDDFATKYWEAFSEFLGTAMSQDPMSIPDVAQKINALWDKVLLTTKAKNQAADSALRQAQNGAISRELNRLEGQAATAGMTDIQKSEYERKRRIDEIKKLENDSNKEKADKAIEYINKIYDAQARKITESTKNAILNVKESARDAANGVFDQTDIKVTFGKMVDLLSVIAQQRL